MPARSAQASRSIVQHFWPKNGTCPGKSGAKDNTTGLGAGRNRTEFLPCQPAQDWLIETGSDAGKLSSSASSSASSSCLRRFSDSRFGLCLLSGSAAPGLRCTALSLWLISLLRGRVVPARSQEDNAVDPQAFTRPFSEKGSPSTRMTCSRRGPCAPRMSVCSISAERDGPVTRLTARGNPSAPNWSRRAANTLS
jgi:hypothetical protein